MRLNAAELARMMDFSAVRADVTIDEVRRLAEVCKERQCICAFVMPCYLAELKALLAGSPAVGVGGVIGFPSGAQSTAIKAGEALEQLALGATELDMVINVGLLRSGEDQRVGDDIRAVADAAGSTPLKVILECHYLTDEEIVRGSRLAVAAGAAFVKTGTGWAPTGATLENIELIKSTVGDTASIKAAGGVRDLAMVVEMIRRGVTRFGVGLDSGVRILDECAALPEGVKI